MGSNILPASFRDPSGFVFSQEGLLYRQINTVYRENYDFLISSGLYETLVKQELLIPHEEVSIDYRLSHSAYKVVKPETINFISQPYEWCFSQLKDAALTTLKIQKIAFDYKMSLKDSSVYNIQFRKGKTMLIDTLSFEKYREGEPWVAYRQFCQHFLAPLSLMAYRDVRLSQLFRIFIDGIPLDLASLLLPKRTYFSFPLLFNIHLHAKSQRHFAGKAVKKPDRKIGRIQFLGIIDSLETAIKKMKWCPGGTEWADYYDNTNYSSEAFQTKKQILSDFLDEIKPDNLWDLGANTGVFSRVSASKGINTIAFDIDPAAVEKNYLECVRTKSTNILPLLLDLTNPSPDIGWQNQERESIMKRGPADTVLALALIHHLAISNNLPFYKIADFFSKICKNLIIEFVPKSDS
ncbi:MAG TPA: SAM-dependent methyltransferase, partial [Candidatus Eremiobacteraeota bacterium]|nr:SAM-dependent methyltransferase [Candidatus Eremiobacteraeota bacterium]